MVYFDFGMDVVDRVINEFNKAEKYIRIAIFQLHNQQVFEVLNQKLQSGVEVEIFTLPYDSINEDVQKRVINQFKSLQAMGAKLHFCKWNIGDPERTSTAVGRWYSFHGKFIVTEKSAVSLSANFIDQSELDAVLIFENDIDKISEYNKKFDELLELFVLPAANSNGAIRKNIINTNIPNVQALFELPRIIETDTHKYHWITDYPSILCPDDMSFNDQLLFCPFDVKGRNLIIDLIEEADKYVYISTESFTDLDIADYLVKNSLGNIEIRILTGATSMDFSDRMQKMLRNLIASGISVHTVDGNIHAKLLITDKRVTVSSINLNKIGLGFKISAMLWRSNTETATICSDQEVIAYAKSQFETVFIDSIDIAIILAGKIEKEVTNIFTKFYGLRSRKEVKKLFSRLILCQEISVKQVVLKIGNITAKLMSTFNRNMVGKDDFLMALILYYLSERKQDFDQLDEKLSILDTPIYLSNLLINLSSNGFIEKDGDFYKLRIESLFSGESYDL